MDLPDTDDAFRLDHETDGGDDHVLGGVVAEPHPGDLADPEAVHGHF